MEQIRSKILLHPHHISVRHDKLLSLENQLDVVDDEDLNSVKVWQQREKVFRLSIARHVSQKQYQQLIS